MIKVSVIVVHYGATKEVFKCLDSIEAIRRKEKNIEFIFVDNEEVNTTGRKIQKKYPWVKYIKSPYNLGFGGGRNLGRENASGEYLLFLDSDITIDFKSFRFLYRFLIKNKKAALVAPELINISGKPTPQATAELTPVRGIFFLSFLNKIFPGNPITKKYLLSDWDRTGIRQVEVAQLGGFMIRREAFEDVGGFDEEMFLYFEENDFSSNLRDRGWKIFFSPDAKVTHLESHGTPKDSDRIKQAFAESRYIYFKKHYGILAAILVDAICRISKNTLIFLAILIFGTFLRFYKAKENLIFNGEMGYDYMTIRNFVENHQIPLIGPRTSHEWFFIGPLFYWIFGLLMPLFNYNVLVGTYFFAVVGAASILVCYLVVKSLFGQKAALISSFLISFSPLWVQLTRDARFNALTAVLFFPFYYVLVRATRDRGKSLFLLGLILGLMFSFFPSPILLLPSAMIVIFYFRSVIDKKYFVPGILGFLIPNIPYLLYNIQNKFDIIGNLLIWIPYRIAGFAGLYPKNTVSPDILKDNIIGLYTFFQQSYLHDNNILILVLISAVISFTLTQLKKNHPLQILLIVAAVSYLGLFLHGNPPQHYYLVIFPIPIILLSLFLEKLSSKFLWLAILIAGYLLFFNLKFYFSENWFYVNSEKISADLNYVPYSLQIKVADFIADDAGDKKFRLGRVGPLDQFGENFSLNYQYLLRMRGKFPDKSAGLGYTIYEDTRSLPQDEKIFWIENLAISKNEK